MKIFLIHQPFKGWIITEGQYFDGIPHEWNYRTPSAYIPREAAQNEKWVDSEEFDAIHAAFLNDKKTEVEPTTEEAFYHALECLPPCRWGSVGAFEVFHVSERIYGDLVDWFARKGDKFFCFIDSDKITKGQILNKLNKVG